MDEMLFYFCFLFIMLVIIMALVAARRNAANAARQRQAQTTQTNTQRQQLVEDIKATKTGRVVDQISIIEELSGTSSNYRQYCEVIGHAMNSGGVTAPYSKQQVAYYDVRCYRVDSNGETLISREKSTAPFFFTDSSCDTPVYVDVDSFGNNCILVKAADRLEGPNSDFSKALNNAMQNQGNRSWSTAGFARYPGGFGMGGPQFYGGQMPQNLNTFLGGMGNMGNYYGGPAYRRGSSGTEALIGIGLGMLLSSITASMEDATTTTTTTSSDPNGSFRGYHIVEDVVPLGSPIYCLGEMYKTGESYYMGKSISSTYPSSYFATKAEAEVIAHLA